MSKSGNHECMEIDPLRCDKRSPMYLSEKSRFKGSFVEEERCRRNQLIQKDKQKLIMKQELQKKIEQMREQNKKSTEEVWAKKLDYLQKKGAPKNLSSVPYNPLTLVYENTRDGRVLKYHDDKVRYRASLRSRKLFFEANRNGYNPVNGKRYDEFLDTSKLVPPEKPFDI